MSSSSEHRTFRAVRRGTALPSPGWQGEVVSVFKRAINILCGGERLVSLVTEELQMAEFSLLLEALPPFTEGLQVWESRERIYGTAPGAREEAAVVELSGAAPWSGRIAPERYRLPLSPSPDELRRAVCNYRESEGFRGLACDEENLWLSRARRVLSAAAEAAAAGEAMELGGIVGLGVGFTPSGDDFILGACAVEELLVRAAGTLRDAGAPPRMLPHIDRGAIAAKAGSTTYGGAALLRGAAGGSYSALVLELLQQLSRADSPEALERLTDTAGTYGATSGIDTLTGMWWYLDLTARLTHPG
jgi:hypothetical protein